MIILLPSRFNIKQKGHDIALEACHLLKQKKIAFRLLITGIKPQDYELSAVFLENIRHYDLQNEIMLSTYSNMQEAYAACDIVISPERYCSYGLSISESLSLGIPTVINEIPTYSEITKGFPHVHYFTNNDPQALANTLFNIIEKQNIERDRKGAIDFRSKNDIRECAKQFSAIYITL